MADTPALIPPDPQIVEALEKLTGLAKQGAIRALFVSALCEGGGDQSAILGEFTLFEAVGAIEVLKMDVMSLSAPVEGEDGLFTTVAVTATKQ